MTRSTTPAPRARPPARPWSRRRRSRWPATATVSPRWPTTWCATRSPTRPPGTPVRVSVSAQGGMGVMQVSDEGPGPRPGAGGPGIRPLLPGRRGTLQRRHRVGAGHRAGHRGVVGGNALVSSTPGSGAVFTVEIPLVVDESPARPTAPGRHRAGARPPSPHGRRRRRASVGHRLPRRRPPAPIHRPAHASSTERALAPGASASRTGTSLTVVSVQLGVGSEPATMPAPASGGRRPFPEHGRADADDPLAVAGPSTHPTGPAQWPRGEGSSSAMTAKASSRGTPADRGGGMERRPATRAPRAARQPPSRRSVPDSARAEVGHRAQADQRGLVGHRQLGAAGAQHGRHRLDDQPVLDPVLGRGQEVLGRPPAAAVAGALVESRRPGQGMTLDGGPRPAHQKLG